MRVAKIDKCEICNGNNVGASLFTQNCPYHCPHCHNMSTWAANGGEEYTQETQEKILEVIEPDYIKRFSILGGEPLLPQNVHDLKELIRAVQEKKPNISIWLWTGATVVALAQLCETGKSDDKVLNSLGWTLQERYDLVDVIMSCDYIIDGRFEEDKKDLTLRWRGSSNQMIWDCEELDKLFNTPE